MTIPGAGPGNDLSTLGAAGCTAVDFAFTNFNNSTFSGNGGNGVGTLAGTYLAETPAGTGLSPLTNPDTLLFATVRGAANVSTNGDSNDGLNNFTANHNTNISDTINFNVAPSVGGDASAYLTDLQLTVFNPAVTGSGSGSIAFHVCAGSGISGVAATASLSACNTAGGTFFTTTLTLATASSLTTTLNLTGFQTNLDISSIVTLTPATGSGNNSGFDTFSVGFDEAAPEPSSFILLGTAFAGLGILRLRKRTA